MGPGYRAESRGREPRAEDYYYPVICDIKVHVKYENEEHSFYKKPSSGFITIRVTVVLSVLAVY